MKYATQMFAEKSENIIIVCDRINIVAWIVLLKLSKKENILIINNETLLSLPVLTTKNALGSYRMMFMTCLKLGVSSI